MIISHLIDPSKDLKHRQFLKGGSLCWMPSHTNARKHSMFKDKHGRWLGTRITTKTSELVLLFAYRVCVSTITGETTTIAAREQLSLLQSDHPNALNVRKAFMDDLRLMLQQERAEGQEILTIADGNSPATHDEFVQFFH